MGILRGSLCNILSGLVYLNKSKVRLEMSSEMERLGKLKGKSYIQVVRTEKIIKSGFSYESGQLESANICCDGDYLYIYTKEQGLAKLERDSGETVKLNPDFLEGKEGGNLFVIDQQLYFRCKGVYLLRINKLTLQLQYAFPEENIRKGQRLFFKEQEDNQPLNTQSDHSHQESTQISIDNHKNQAQIFRSKNKSQAFSDNHNLYILSEEQATVTGADQLQTIYVIDVYQIHNDIIIFQKTIPLKNKKNTLDSLLPTILKKSQFSCNGRYVLINDHTGLKYIDLKTGTVTEEKDKNTGKNKIECKNLLANDNIICYDHIN